MIRHNVNKMNQALEDHRTHQSRQIEYDKINNAIQSNDELVVFNNGLYSATNPAIQSMGAVEEINKR